MLGFLTLVSLGVAIGLGGWWWAGAIFLSLAWLGKRRKAKEERQAGTSILKKSGKTPNGEWSAELIDACSKLTGLSYYVGDLIPEKKREVAMARYPLPGDTEILALIDATVFGSAKKGLAIGECGISWKNGFGKPIRMEWDELARSKISSSGVKVSVGALKFENVSRLKLRDVEALLLRLQAYALALNEAHEAGGRGDKKIRSIIPEAGNVPKLLVAVNRAAFDELLALPGIGAAEAHMIIKRRGERSFTSNTEMTDYLDLKPHVAAKLDGLTDFEPALAGSQAGAAEEVAGNTLKPNALAGRTID